jgi:streptogramin lyase
MLLDLLKAYTVRRGPAGLARAAAGLLLAGLLLTAAGGPAAAQTPIFFVITDFASPPPDLVSATIPFVFNVILTAPSTQTVQVGYTTTDGTPASCAPYRCAVAGVDYIPQSGILTFAPGETQKVIIVPVLGRTERAPNKLFNVLLVNPVNALFTNPFGNAKITNQTPPPETTGTACATEYANGFKGHGGGLTLGPDGNFWTTEQYDAKLGSFDPRTLTATEYELPPDTFPHFITVGPDGNLWFTDLHDRVGMFDIRAKKATMYSQGITLGSVPHFILVAPDGNLYFSEQAEENDPLPGGPNKTYTHKGRIAQINPTTKVITEYPGLLPEGSRIHGMVVGPDGHIWAGLEGTDELVRFNLGTKKFDRFVSFSQGSGPHDLLLGPDNNIYVILQTVNRIGQFDPATGETHEYPTSLTREDGPSLVFLTVGPDKKSLWFSEFLNDRIGRFDLVTHKVTDFACGVTPNSAPIGITVGPDNNIWFSEPVLDTRVSGRMGRLIPQ